MRQDVGGVHLLKRYDPQKGVEHYGVGVDGLWACFVARTPVVIQLTRAGVVMERWEQTPGDLVESILTCSR